MKYMTIINNEQFEIEIDNHGEIKVNGEPREVDFLQLSPSLYSVIMDNNSLQVVIDQEQSNYSIMISGKLYEGQVLDERALMMAQRKGGLGGTSGEINSPMPGLVVKVVVEVGQRVEAGQTVVILESMKMQNELKSPIAGTVETVKVDAGQSVDKNALLAIITPDEEPE
ncbi:MAG: acetyl-CoA carboxylase biotin carboxyl carrier protein subunit [Aggregatilineales bacterium]